MLGLAREVPVAVDVGGVGVVIAENAVADPANPQNLLAKYTNKDDGIHPYNGYQVMANAIDLNLFQ